MQFLIGKDYGRAMARAHFLQPARASLVDEWAGFVREQYPAKSADLDVGAFADGQRKGYSVTAEVFASNMDEVQRIVYETWDRIFVLGTGSVDEMADACRKIEAVQKGR